MFFLYTKVTILSSTSSTPFTTSLISTEPKYVQGFSGLTFWGKISYFCIISKSHFVHLDLSIKSAKKGSVEFVFIHQALPRFKNLHSLVLFTNRWNTTSYKRTYFFSLKTRLFCPKNMAFLASLNISFRQFIYMIFLKDIYNNRSKHSIWRMKTRYLRRQNASFHHFNTSFTIFLVIILLR